MTTGRELKKQLGLDNLKNIKIARFIISSYKIYGVFYDSWRDMMVTTYRIRKSPMVATVFSGTALAHKTKKYTILTPPQDLIDFNGSVKGTLVIPIDLAGDKFINDKPFTKKFEKLQPLVQFNDSLREYVTLADLNTTATISPNTARFRKDRNRLLGTENTQAKLLDCFIDDADNSVRFVFLTTVTPYPDDDKHQYKDADPEHDWILAANPSEVYELQIKILDFHSWLDTFEGSKVTWKDVKDILDVSNIQVSSTSPSFNWQGFAYWLTQIDGCIYPQTIKPKRWDFIHGDGEAFLDKHLWGLLNQIAFFQNQMASKLQSQLMKRGLI